MTNEEVTQLINEYAGLVLKKGGIDNELYTKYEVKRGLRDVSGKGVLVGLTEISEIVSYIIEDGDMLPCEGKLFYRGINIEKIVQGFLDEGVLVLRKRSSSCSLDTCPTKRILTSLPVFLRNAPSCRTILSATRS